MGTTMRRRITKTDYTDLLNWFNSLTHQQLNFVEYQVDGKTYYAITPCTEFKDKGEPRIFYGLLLKESHYALCKAYFHGYLQHNNIYAGNEIS